MFKRSFVSTLTIAVFAALSFAHGDATHIIGTVTAVDNSHVSVKTQDGKTEMVMLQRTTKFMNGSKSATVADLKAGTRVVIDAKMDEKMKMFTAQEVKIGVATAAKADRKAVPAAKHDDRNGHK